MSFRKYNNGNNSKIKTTKKETYNNILGNTNYVSKHSLSKFNSIGKLISTNFQLYSLEKPNKQSSIKHKLFNNINNQGFRDSHNHFRGRSIDFQKNANLKSYSSSKSECDICNENINDEFYDTISDKKQNNLFIMNNKKEDNIISSLHNTDVVYKNYFGDNKYNSNTISQTHSEFFNNNNFFQSKYKSKEKYKNLQKTRNNKIENILLKSIDNNLSQNTKNDTFYNEPPINPINSCDIKNLKLNYKISNYASCTLSGTDAMRNTKTNQDSFLLKEEISPSEIKEYTFGVFDGHGIQGNLVSQGIKNYLLNINYTQYSSKKNIINLFNNLSKNINSSKNFDVFCSGSTVVLTHINNEKIICANCGDSRAILITNNNKIIKLSRDHKPNLPDEKKRIINNGGRIDKIYGMGPFRVWSKDGDYPGLAMSRSIGDSLAHKIGVSDIPEIMEFNISNVKPFCIVVASDGVWEFMNNEKVKIIVNKYKYNQNAENCSKEIVDMARKLWEGTTFAIDDITCIVIFFDSF